MSTMQQGNNQRYATTGGGYYEEYSVAPAHSGVVVHKEEASAMGGFCNGCCAIIATVLFIILIVLLVIALIIFFTIGGKEVTDPPTVANAHVFGLTVNGGVGQQRALLHGGASEARTISPYRVETMLQREPDKICLFDTAYLNNDYKKLFADEHIAGARHFDIERAITRSATQRRNLVQPLKFDDYLRELGVHTGCTVVLYDHGEVDNSIITATYAWWLFKVFGIDDVSVMAGGLRQWRAAKLPMETGAPAKAQRGDVTAGWRHQYLATREDVQRNFDTGESTLVDARSTQQYHGREKHQLAKLPGRIKGALSIPSTTLLTSNLTLKSNGELGTMLDAVDGLEAGSSVIVYCNTAMQATSVYFALIRNGHTGEVYDGSWVEWSHVADESLMEATPFG